ncbi:MAG: LysR family transcriptional regulator [Myxococcota bacterium]
MASFLLRPHRSVGRIVLRMGSMTDGHPTALDGVDLNLLRLFDALCAEGSVTAAGARLGLTQSGASRALARLRAALDDPLFVTGRTGLIATPRAEALRGPVREALGLLAGALEPVAFDPAGSTQPLRLGCPDHLAWLLAGPLTEALAARAPGMELVLTSFSGGWLDDLHDGVVDLAFGVLAGTEAHVQCRTLFEDGWAVLMRERHPDLERPWTVETFASGAHGVMTVSGTGLSHVDRGLEALGYARNITIRATSPVVVAAIATETDVKVTTSAWLAHHLAERLGAAVRPVPLDVPALPLPLVWHVRFQHDPRHRFVRSLLAETVAQARHRRLG